MYKQSTHFENMSIFFDFLMTKEALNYRRALFNGFESLKKLALSTRTAVDICTTLKNCDMNRRKQLGTAL